MAVIYEESRQVQVRIEADVVVCGGGPSGIAAALSAARQGAKTLLIERYGFLGGMGTAGLVSSFAYGYHDKHRFIIGGIFSEFRQKLHDRNALIMTARHGWEPFNPEIYKILAFQLLQEAGVTILCHTLIADVQMQLDNIAAIIIESKAGREAIVAKTFVDATGDGDVAARAGVPFEIGRPSDHATQPQTFMYVLGNVDIDETGRYLSHSGRRGFWHSTDGQSYLNATGFQQELVLAQDAGYSPDIPRSDISSIYTVPWLQNVVGVNFGRVQGKNALDPQGLTEAELEGRYQAEEGLKFLRKFVPGFQNAQFITGAPQIGVRETRRIQGDYVITEQDIIEQRQFSDVIAQSCYMIDIHSPDSDQTVLIKLPPGTHYDIPYRSLLPVGTDNLILAGRCISATHGALGSFRVQAVCFAIGEAAGKAAALSIQHGLSPRQIPYQVLHDTLIKNGAILH